MPKSVFKRIFAVFLSLLLCLSWLPAGVLAEETREPVQSPETASPSEEPSPATEETVPATEETIPVTEETIPVPEATVPTTEAPIPATEETLPPETLPEETSVLTALAPEPQGPGLYFGQLHAHSDLSDGTLSPEEVFSRAALAGMDFLALTDHGDSLTEADWTAGKSAAEAAAGNAFMSICGYEMNWPARMQIGHISVFGTPGFLSWQEGYDAFDGALDHYYAAMSNLPGAIGQFNHPGTQYGNFRDFYYYSEAADGFMQLLETDGSCEQYIKALDAGWHVAPSWASDSRSGDFGTGRTAVYADTLTEEGLYDALRSRRVYATEDSDLEIRYTMDGYNMGSIPEDSALGETADISVTLSDPTDSAVGLVEVIADGGAILGSQTLSAACGTLFFSLPTEYSYYFLRITQPDGDIALTAPVWVSHTEDLGITSLTCETAVPVQNEEISLQLALYNREKADFLVDSLEILADGDVIFTDSDLAQIPGNSDLIHNLSLLCDCLGQTTITARLTGTLEGSPQVYEASLNLSFRQSALVTDILVTGGAAPNDLDTLKSLAAEADIRVSITEELTAEALENCRFLVISTPQEPFSEAFINTVSEYAAWGGSVILCGQADGEDGAVHAAFQLNRVLSALGSSLWLRDDTAWDSVTNGGTSNELYLDEFNTDSVWCDGISKNQVYRLAPGCTVEPGGGQWLVQGRGSTHSVDGDGDGLGGSDAGNVTVLACEALISGGTVFAAGSLFFSDDNIPAPENSWDKPYANRTIVRNLLNLGGETLSLRTVAEARAGETGKLFRIRGFVTAGTSNPYNAFPDTIYLQDDTGGIAVTPLTEGGIRVGTPMEITGYADIQNGNRILKPVSFEILDAALYQYQPRTGSWKNLLDYGKNGGRLVEIEGECTQILRREDGTLAGITLKDKAGNTAEICIEDFIFSGATGKNTLHEEIRKGRTVRAMGLLHISEAGDTVIRVRNCDEVVYVPPETYLNPKTGDALPLEFAAMVLSGLGLSLLRKRKKA